MRQTRERRDVSDLIVLDRRGDLSESDRRSLRDLLASSPEDRFLDEAGRAFDDEGSVEAGDDERIAAIERAVSERLAPKPATRPRWVLRLIAAAILLASGAFAVDAVRARQVHAPEPIPNITPTSAPTSTPSVAPTIAPIVTAIEPQPEPQPSASIREVHPHPTVSAPAPVPKTERSAAELFAAANDARVRGDTNDAIRLSRELVDRYPSSREASTTRLSLGMLYLKSGDATSALEQFRLSRESGAQTTAEALWGEAQALRALGRKDEERTTLERLLAEHAQSAYASAARKRLTELAD